MGKYQAYMEYKDFEGVFLTEIPASWKVKPLHTLCDFRQGKAHEPFVDGDGQFICVNARFVSTQGHSAKRCTENLTPAYLHDVLMVMSDLPNGRALARAFYVEEKKDYAVNQRICAITAKKICAKFLFYQLDRSPYFLMYDDGSNQTHLSNDTYKKYPVLLPSVSEQQIIANFLDHETAKIDILIEKQQQLIVLLKEKRQAVISHAVTKGLNANAPMRDSGVEWLGEVPEHWVRSSPGKACSIVSKGTTPSRQSKSKNEIYKFPFIIVNNLSLNGELDESKLIYIPDYEHSDLLSRSILYPGDVLFNIVGPPLGKAAIVSESYSEWNTNQAVAFFRPVNVINYFLRDWLQSDFCESWFMLRVKKTSGQANLTLEMCRDVPLLIPPVKEQKEIVEYCGKFKARINRLIEKCEDQSCLLLERRTALISAAVTGKIDVRKWAEKGEGQ
jgi:type I restriction enzyme S subunit